MKEMREAKPNKNLFDKIQDSEINFRIETFWNQGYNVFIGDELNGFKENIWCDTFQEAEAILVKLAIKYYPNSEFAKWYKQF